MNIETKKIYNQRKKELKQLLKDAKEERQAIINKFNDGDKVTKKEEKRKNELGEFIKSLEKKLEAFNEIDKLESMLTKLRSLKNNTAKDANKTIKELIADFEHFKFVDEDILAIEADMVEKDLVKLTSSMEDVKEEIYKKYRNIINEYEDYYLTSDLLNEEELPKKDNENSLAKKTKKKLAELNEKMALSKQKVKYVFWGSVVVIALTFALVHALKNQTPSNNNEKPEDPTPTPGLEDDVRDPKRETAEKLTSVGYDEIFAIQMAHNFDQQTIDYLLEMPFIEEVQKYSQDRDFTIDYLKNYEDARTIYNLTSSKAVDYVNRAVQINRIGFYEDAEINDIVKVIMAVDNKELFITNNGNLGLSISATFNPIVEKYLLGTVTEEDVEKLDAIPYFAKKGSDVHAFLTEFTTLIKANLVDSNDLEAKENIYEFIATFALSLNGFDNTDPDIPVKKPYNENAQIDDYRDFYGVYTTFVAPFYPAIFPSYDAYVEKANAEYSNVLAEYSSINNTEKENNEAAQKATEAYNKVIAKYNEEFERLYNIQLILNSALEGPEFEQICGQGLTLGGE